MYSIRDWWREYLSVIRRDSGTASLTRLNEMTTDLQQQGIIKPRTKMPRDGAEDLATEYDDIMREREKRYRLASKLARSTHA